MSPRHLSSDKWSELPLRDRSREIRFIAQTAQQLGFTRPGVERALVRGTLEGCRVEDSDGTVRVAVYRDSIEAFVPQRRPASQRAGTDAAVDESLPSTTSTTQSHAAGSTAAPSVVPNVAPTVASSEQLSTESTAAILRLVETIESYESATRHSDTARTQVSSALEELDQAAAQRAAAVETLRNLIGSTVMPTTVADLLDRADRPTTD